MEDKLRDYLKFRMPEVASLSVTGVTRIMGGESRETVSFEAQWMEEGRQIARSFIARMDPIASLLESNRDMEYGVLASLESTPVPVPRVYWLEPDEKWLGRPFFIMERLPGTTTPNRLGLFAPEDPALRAKIAKQWVEILARIHTVDWRGLGLSFLGVPEAGTDCARREIDKWEKAIDKNKLEPQPILTEALLWLKSNKPKAERISLVHGDYKQDNILFENEKVIAILDWEMSHLGDPMEDLGWSCMGFYRQGTELVGGLLEREKLYRCYEGHSGIKVDEGRVFFYEVLASVKMAAIAITGVKSFSEQKSRNLALGSLGSLISRLEDDLANQLGF
jgi:aminoglycoside phosphotransferase (APT) family kinase protein